MEENDITPESIHEQIERHTAGLRRYIAGGAALLIPMAEYVERVLGVPLPELEGYEEEMTDG